MYTVAIEIGANTSNYWALMRVTDKKGTVHEKHLSGERTASRNSNHLQAILEAARRLNRPCMLDVYTSEDYVIEPFKQGWIQTWEKNNWKSAKGKTVRNEAQWKELKKALSAHSVRFIKCEKQKGGEQDV